jgi:hypothetical protein
VNRFSISPAPRRARLISGGRVVLAALAGFIAGSFLERGRWQAATDIRPAGPQ